MNTNRILSLIASVALFGITLQAKPNNDTTEPLLGFENLLEGGELSQWQGDLNGKEVEDGILHWRAGGHIWTEETYADFILRFEFTLSEGANNGLAIRWPGEGDPAYTAMCELQILDNEAPVYQKMNLDPRQYHGSAYGMAAAKRGYLNPPGEWNAQEVIVVGSWIRVTLNGEKILDTDLALVTDLLEDKEHPGKDRKSGYIGFAGHGDKHHLQFKNIRVKRLD